MFDNHIELYIVCLIKKIPFIEYISFKEPSPCGVYEESAGTIMSPNYPSNYSNNERCVYVIDNSPPYIIHLTFEVFSTEKEKDVLEVSN